MKKIENILATSESFLIDSSACMQHSQLLRSYNREEETHTWSSHPKPIQLALKVSFISICHQFNWDFLQNTIAEQILKEKSDIPLFLQNIASIDIATWLSNYPKKERIRSEERAAILRDVGQVLRREFNGDIELFYETCNRRNLGSGDFHRILDLFSGYRSDQLRKKTNVLSHDLYKESILEFEDPKNIEPAVDYHIMRLYLRTGRVVPVDKVLFHELGGSVNPRGSLVRQLRKAVSEAVKLTAFYADLNVADTNYIEWQIGRSICLNGKPACQSSEPSKSIAQDIQSLFSGRCPYIEVCESMNSSPNFINFEEPNFISSNY